MSNTTIKALIYIIGLFIPLSAALADVAPRDWRQQLSEQVWLDNLRSPTFQDREIIEDARQNVLEVKAPYRTEDATVTPISIQTKIPQTDELYIQRIHVFIDKNPVPLVGMFDFTPASGKADLAMRVRVNDYSFVRAIAELNTGELYMTKSFIRANGGCSAPPPKSIDDSIANRGKMKMKLIGGEVKFKEPNLMQLKIKHPNITGLQPMKIGSHVHPPAHFVSQLNINYNEGSIMKARLTFAISMDPSLRFFFVPEDKGTLTVEVTDSKNDSWSSELIVN